MLKHSVFLFDVNQLGHEIFCPLTNVLGRYDLLHLSDRDLLFLFGHLQSLNKRLFDVFGIIGIHNDGIGQFGGCSGHLAEDKYPFPISFGGNKLFCYQVHSIPERGHQTDVGNRIESHHIVEVE